MLDVRQIATMKASDDLLAWMALGDYFEEQGNADESAYWRNLAELVRSSLEMIRVLVRDRVTFGASLRANIGRSVIEIKRTRRLLPVWFWSNSSRFAHVKQKWKLETLALRPFSNDLEDAGFAYLCRRCRELAKETRLAQRPVLPGE